MSAIVKNYNIKEIKTSLRKKYRSYREALPTGKKNVFDASIKHNLLKLNEYKENDILFLYVSKEIEVDTYGIMAQCWQDGKTVAVPRCVPGTRDMEFYRIRQREDLEEGTFGVMEPIVSQCEKITDFSHGLCVVPGLCFDAKGFRLGYGKGYYDRFLSGFQGSTAGICYAECVQWNLPHGYFDRPVDVLVTENYIRRISKGRKKGGAR
ncbi:MAG: 5-formyltetrahydrofolate cyclo-ligase [Oscillospiraceae bacterium]|nr:5-formyltetrahydrofolate cyclo-ligase [Oscillospiraceae bacterium]